MARAITLFGCVPVIMNPPIRTLLPVSTRKRVEMFPKVLGIGVPAITEVESPALLVKVAAPVVSA